MARRSSTPELEMLPGEEGQPVYDVAREARAAGKRIFTCTLTVGSSAGSSMGFGGKKTSQFKAWEPSEFIEAVEALGWLLSDCQYVWNQTENVAGMVKGLTRAHLLFRRG